MDPNEISEELIAKAKACTTPEEMLALAKSEDFELSLEELDAVTGGDGSGWSHMRGDMRDDIDESLMPEEFKAGELRGDELD